MVFRSQPATFEAHLATDPELVYNALIEVVLTYLLEEPD